ncbi:hypothetical protein [Thermosulfuriphilus sp.]
MSLRFKKLVRGVLPWLIIPFGILFFLPARAFVWEVVSVDTNKDGRADRFYYLGEADDSLRVEADTDLDGRVDRWEIFKGDQIVSLSKDTNSDGLPDTRYLFEGWGQISRLERDEDGDGIFEVRVMFSEGKVERIIRPKGAGREEIVFDKGRVIQLLWDLDGDGLPERTFYFNDQGKIFRIESKK